MTLYYFSADTKGRSVCTGDCAVRWPAFHAHTIITPPGPDPSNFSIITRDDGEKQAAYKGIPLYVYGRDERPGNTKGQGMYNMWFVVSP